MSAEIVGSAAYDLDLDQKKFETGIKKAGQNFKEFGDKLSSVGKSMTMKVTLPIMGIGVVALKTAADYEDAVGASSKIFKGQSDNMKEWADSLPTYYGIAKSEALQYTNTMGAMLQNIGGLNEEAAAEQSQKLLEMAGDLSAMFGGTTDEAVRALTGSLKGNNTMLDNYGMAVNDAMIKTKAFEMGLMDEGDQMTLATKQAATLALISEQTGDSFGQAKDEAKGASGTIKSMTTELKNLSIEIGQVLIPIIVPMLQKVKEWILRFKELSPRTKELIVKFALLAAAIGPVLMIVGSLIGAITTIAGVISLPVLAIAGLVLIIGGLGLALYKLADHFGLVEVIGYRMQLLFDKAKASWNTLKEAFASPEVQAKLAILQMKFQELWASLEPVFEKLKEAFNKLWDPFDKVFGDDSAEGLFTFEGAVNLISGAIDGLIMMIDLLMPVFEFMVEAIVKVIDAVMWFNDVFIKLAVFFSDFDGNMRKLWEDLKTFLINKLNELGLYMLKVLTEDIPYYLGVLIKEVGIFAENLPNLIGQMVVNVISWFDNLRNQVTGIAISMIDNIVGFFMGLPQRLKAIWSMIVAYFQAERPNMNNIGASIIQGFWDGLKGKMGQVMAWVSAQVTKIKNSFKRGLEIHSPSRVFKFFGEMIGQGLQDGMTSGLEGASGLYNNLIDTSSPNMSNLNSIGARGVDSALSGNGSLGGVVVNFNPSGIVARSRSEWRDIVADGIQAVNEDLRSRGLPVLGDGQILGTSNIN